MKMSEIEKQYAAALAARGGNDCMEFDHMYQDQALGWHGLLIDARKERDALAALRLIDCTPEQIARYMELIK
jgi:hypothetical protein